MHLVYETNYNFVFSLYSCKLHKCVSYGALNKPVLDELFTQIVFEHYVFLFLICEHQISL